MYLFNCQSLISSEACEWLVRRVGVEAWLSLTYCVWPRGSSYAVRVLQLQHYRWNSSSRKSIVMNKIRLQLIYPIKLHAYLWHLPVGWTAKCFWFFHNCVRLRFLSLARCVKNDRSSIMIGFFNILSGILSTTNYVIRLLHDAHLLTCVPGLANHWARCVTIDVNRMTWIYL